MAVPSVLAGDRGRTVTPIACAFCWSISSDTAAGWQVFRIDADQHRALGRQPQQLVFARPSTRRCRGWHDPAELVDACLPGGEALERTVDTHLGKLRRKLEDAGVPGHIRNIRGVGFRLLAQS